MRIETLQATSEMVESEDGTFGFTVTLTGFLKREDANSCSNALAEPFGIALMVALEAMHGEPQGDGEIRIN
jgi:hypothetical protein